ncbi:MAG: SDR family oxidoreductase [Oscillospiraceae bacterium]|nr:SDR family oxidoreductase [Oscillospiraceae bacterium]MBR6430859.1 SDR family oxidoreductase [Oscillospiraceae bacterium]
MSIVHLPPITSMEDAFSVKGLNVVVTGGNRGIGKGIATAFAQSGSNVAILCRNKPMGDAVAEDLAQYGVRTTCIRVDISDIDSVKQAEQEVFAFFDHLDVLVNNAGVATTTPFLQDEGMKEWYRVLNTDLNGVANMIHTFAPHMVQAGRGGSIINTSSVGGHRVGGGKDHPNPPYHTAKAGLDHFTRYLAIELGDAGIRVNCIAPGPFHSDLDADLPPSFLEQIDRNMPMHRFGEPIELGAYAVFLASPAARMITGAVCVVDGGLTCANG